MYSRKWKINLQCLLSKNVWAQIFTNIQTLEPQHYDTLIEYLKIAKDAASKIGIEDQLQEDQLQEELGDELASEIDLEPHAPMP